MKFKVGDIVRVKKDEKLLHEVSLCMEDFNGWFEGVIESHYVGEKDRNIYYVKSTKENWGYSLLEDSLELVDDETKCYEDEPLDYESEYHRLLLELEQSKLLNDILLEYIKLTKH